MKKTIEKLLADSRIAIEGTLANADILGKMSKYGYNQKVLQEGKVLREKLEMVVSLRDEGFGSQKNATRQLQKARSETHQQYMRHLTIARVALQNLPQHWDVLRLQGIRKTDISGWLAQVSAFYYNFDRVQEIMDKHGVTADEIAQGKAMIEAVASYRVQQMRGISDKQQASQQRQEAMLALQTWMRDFLYIARFALKDNPQQMEALGKRV